MTHHWDVSGMVGRDGAGPLGLGVPGLVERWLWARGYRDAASAAEFLDPKLTALHDPSLLPGCDRACARLLEAMRTGEGIVIYGDYDVDGMTASAILYRVIRAIAPEADVRTYVPHRLDEGYGLHTDAIERLAAEGARVVVSVDCGITAFEPAARARDIGLDLIITDHHNPPAVHRADGGDRGSGGLPGAFAIVHPRVPGSRYPFGELCGAGVAFKIAWRLATMASGGDRVGEALRLVLLDAVALASLGTIADIVPLVGENRVIARFGLARVRSTAIEGLSALVRASGLEGESIDSGHVGFVLGPRLNACGRMGHAREAVELLTVAEGERAEEIAGALTRMNEDRRGEERRIAGEARERAERAGMTGGDARAIVLADEGWHPGVIGIVCSRLIGHYHRPTILLNRADGLLQGSGRSIDGFNLHAALEACSSHLTRFGGHDMAAGMAMQEHRLDGFVADFMDYAARHIDETMLRPRLGVDCEAGVEELTGDAVRRLESLGPFGRSNARPRLLLRRVVIERDPTPMGSDGSHMSVQIGGPGGSIRLVGWNWGARVHRIRRGERMDVVMTPKINTWRGTARVEGELQDLRVCEPTAISSSCSRL